MQTSPYSLTPWTPAQILVVASGGLGLLALFAQHVLGSFGSHTAPALTLPSLGTGLFGQAAGIFILSAGILVLGTTLAMATLPVRGARASVDSRAGRHQPASRPAAQPYGRRPLNTDPYTDTGPLPQPSAFRAPPPPVAPATPTPLASYAETLLERATTIPNFRTTPLPGQQRVLAKLADNFVPPPQRAAALALAMIRLRRPHAA